MPTIAIVGNTSIDHIEIGTLRRSILGGGAINVSVGCVLNGLRPCPITLVGDDMPSKELESLLSRVDDSGVGKRRGKSCSFRMVYDHPNASPAIYSEAGVSAELTAYASSAARSVDHLHVCCRWPLESELVLRRWHTVELGSVSIDFIHSSIEDQVRRVMPLLREIRWVFLNEREMGYIRDLITLEATTSVFFVTGGPTGVQVVVKGSVIHTEPGAQVQTTIDSSGAGDVFAGATLAGLMKGTSIPSATRQGVLAAARSVRDYGTTHLLEVD